MEPKTQYTAGCPHCGKPTFFEVLAPESEKRAMCNTCGRIFKIADDDDDDYPDIYKQLDREAEIENLFDDGSYGIE